MIFEKKYYVRSEISNYEDYRKKKFDILAQELIKHLDLKPDSSILDYGAATGGLIAALKEQGLTNITGTDISYWAVNFGRKEYNLTCQELQHYNRQLLEENFEYIFILDVLEHMQIEELHNVFNLINAKKILIRIPISVNEGEDFHFEVSRYDKTHIQCHCREWWIDLFEQYNYELLSLLNLETIYDSDGVFSAIFSKKS